jgi:transketolase
MIMRETFIETATALLAEDPRTAVVLADISADAFAPAARRHPDRVLNVGIREQLMLGVAGGLALTGLRPIVHSYATFAVDRAYEQIKLDLNHQGVGAVLVSIGGSYDASAEGRTHMSPGDVALLDTLAGWTVHVPGHADEVPSLLRAAVGRDEPVYLRLSTGSNDAPHTGDDGLAGDDRLTGGDGPASTGGLSGGDGLGGGLLQVLRRGSQRAALVVAVGPMLDPVLRAVEGLDVTVAYTHTPRPFDVAGLRALAGSEVILVEPYLAGTSSRLVAEALADRPHRSLSLGVGRADLRRYGTPADHARWHGLDAAGLRRSISAFLG